MRIAIGQIAHETNTFSNVATTVERFKSWEWDYKEKIIERHLGVDDYVGALLINATSLVSKSHLPFLPLQGRQA